MDSKPEHASGGVTSYGLQFIDYPALDFICKLIEVDIFLILIVRLTVYLDIISGKLAGKLDVQSTLADGKRDLTRLKINLCLLL